MVVAAVAGSIAYNQLKTTSSAVKGTPSCQVTPRLSFHTTDLPSAATPPLSRLGISAASTGSRLASASQLASGSWKMRQPSASLVPVAKCGFSSVGPCQNSSLSAPPPPRRVGLYGAGVATVCATPASISSTAAIGAVSPRPTRRVMKLRRGSAPRRTCSIRLRMACSCIMFSGFVGWAHSGGRRYAGADSCG